jgi:hypothetical protein
MIHPSSFTRSKVQRRRIFAAPGISPLAAIACTVRIGRPISGCASSMVIRSRIEMYIVL